MKDENSESESVESVSMVRQAYTIRVATAQNDHKLIYMTTKCIRLYLRKR